MTEDDLSWGIYQFNLFKKMEECMIDNAISRVASDDYSLQELHEVLDLVAYLLG